MRKVLVPTLSLAGLALAQTSGPDFSSVSVNLAGVFGLAGTVVAALANLIVIRKAIKLMNKS